MTSREELVGTYPSYLFFSFLANFCCCLKSCFERRGYLQKSTWRYDKFNLVWKDSLLSTTSSTCCRWTESLGWFTKWCSWRDSAEQSSTATSTSSLTNSSTKAKRRRQKRRSRVITKPQNSTKQAKNLGKFLTALTRTPTLKTALSFTKLLGCALPSKSSDMEKAQSLKTT